MQEKYVCMFVNNLESEELKNTDMKSLAVPVLYTLYEYFYFSFNTYCIKLRIDVIDHYIMW